MAEHGDALPSIIVCFEADTAAGRTRICYKLADIVEQDPELGVVLGVLLLEIFDSARKIFVFSEKLSESDKRPRDGDARLDRTLASEYRRKHHDAMLGEHTGSISAGHRCPELEVAFCDLKMLASSRVSWNIKSAGKRLMLRLTCSLRAFCGNAV